MTNNTRIVSQRARDAAADALECCERAISAQYARSGRGDDDPVVEVFARFEEETLALSRDGEREAETGWLIEEDAGGFTHWIALADIQWPRSRREYFNEEYENRKYLSHVTRVKDANLALRFARRADAEQFIKLFERFLLHAKATEHMWPSATPQHTREAAQDVSDRVRRLVIAARVCAYSDNDTDMKELDEAAEAFAADIPWEDGHDA